MKFFPIILLLAASIFAGVLPGTEFANAQTGRPTPTPTPKINAVPAPTSTLAPTPASTPTMADLQTKIRAKTFDSTIRRGRIGIKITSLASGKVVFENDADKYFMPASNMKNFTVATAIEKLSPDYRFATTISTSATPDSSGALKGDLKITGSGDVSMSTSFDPEFPNKIDHYKFIDMIVEKIAAAGIKKIEGNIIGDESYFRGFALPDGWEWDDLHTYYGAEVSALPLNDNVIDITVRPGTNGGQCVVSVSPATSLVKFVNKCTTGGGNTVSITKAINQNLFEINGSMPAGGKSVVQTLSFSHVAELFADLVKQRLAIKGITVTGVAKTVGSKAELMCPTCASVMWTNIGKIDSPPLSLIAAKTMKPSQNMYTETLLWTLGEQVGRKNNGSGTSAVLGVNVVKQFMREIGVPDDGIVQYDGSGLSRHNLITPAAVVTLYEYMAKKSPYSLAWRNSLTIGGVDGTLGRRFKGTRAEANMRGKTGTINQVSALSGYVRTATGEELVVSLVINGVPGAAGIRTKVLDEIVVALADYNGRVD